MDPRTPRSCAPASFQNSQLATSGAGPMPGKLRKVSGEKGMWTHMPLFFKSFTPDLGGLPYEVR